MADPEPVAELPEPSAELFLLLALVTAHIETMPKKRRDAFLISVHRSLRMQHAAYNVFRFRPRSADPAAFEALRRAQGWWSQALGMLTREPG